MKNPTTSTRRHRRRGFTLVELMVTITIVAVLAAIATGIFFKTRKKANSMKCVAQMRDWSVVFSAATADYNGRLPVPPNWAGISHTPWNPQSGAGRSPFVDYWDPNIEVAFQMQFDHRSCPCTEAGVAGSGNPGVSYMMNRNLGSGTNNLWLNYATVNRASSKIFFIDGKGKLNISGKGDVKACVEPVVDAHGGRVNAIYGDLHVGQIGTKELEDNWNDLIMAK